MQSQKLGRALALGVVAVAAFNTLSALSMPELDRRPSVPRAIAWLLLLLAHAAFYWLGPTVRERFGLKPYVAVQASLVLAIGLSGVFPPVVLGLYIALTVETIMVAGQRWGTVGITIGAIVLFAVYAVASSNLYRGAMAGLLLAVTGVVSHAIGALLGRRTEPARVTEQPSEVVTAVPESENASGLTPREMEVLRALARGARSSRIADDLGISERTVKAHLASIYQKLGVESRTAAVATAVQRGIV